MGDILPIHLIRGLGNLHTNTYTATCSVDLTILSHDFPKNIEDCVSFINSTVHFPGREYKNRLSVKEPGGIRGHVTNRFPVEGSEVLRTEAVRKEIARM